MREGASQSIRQAFFDSVYAEAYQNFKANPRITELMQKVVEKELENILTDLEKKEKKTGF